VTPGRLTSQSANKMTATVQKFDSIQQLPVMLLLLLLFGVYARADNEVQATPGKLIVI